MPNSLQWYYLRESLLGESEEGPFDETQLSQLVKAGKIKLKTKLRSPTRTKNQLVWAESIPSLAKTINQAAIDMDADRKRQAEERRRNRSQWIPRAREGEGNHRFPPRRMKLAEEKFMKSVESVMTPHRVQQSRHIDPVI